MNNPNYTILFVSDAQASANFYNDLLGQAPVESSPNFALFAFDSGLRLGLWSKTQALPAPTGAAGSTEIGFALSSDQAVSALFDQWSAKRLAILQTPTKMDFGFTFVVADPDGHRVRVFAPAA